MLKLNAAVTVKFPKNWILCKANNIKKVEMFIKLFMGECKESVHRTSIRMVFSTVCYLASYLNIGSREKRMMNTACQTNSKKFSNIQSEHKLYVHMESKFHTWDLC